MKKWNNLPHTQIHHIAIGTPNLLNMKNFYLQIPHSKVIQENYYQNGKLRSVWLELAHNVILMLEERAYSKAPEALIFHFPENYTLNELEQIFEFQERTDYTIYFFDPDGNKLGFSSYPKKIIDFLFHKS